MAIAEDQNKYRANVAAIVINNQGLILACERSDISGCWQVPQGGLDPWETPEEGIKRELFEEIGVESIEIIGKVPYLIRYEWKKELILKQDGLVGQEQQYFLVRLLDENEIRLDGHEEMEFCAFEWLTTDEFLSRLTNTLFKKAAIEEAISYFRHQKLIK